MKARFRENTPRLKLNHQLVSFIPLVHGDIEDCIFRGRFAPRVLALTYEALGFDIEKFDERVHRYLQENRKAKAEVADDDFFSMPRIKHV
jgi:hypothetical protein